MFNIGFGEMIMLGVIALIFIGPKQLPEVARVIGRMLNEMKRATEDLTDSFVKTRDSFDTYVKDSEKKITQSLLDVSSDKQVKSIPKEPTEAPEKTDKNQGNT